MTSSLNGKFVVCLQVLFGTTDGQVIVMSSTGAMLAQVTVVDSQEVASLTWSCEKFYLGEQDGTGVGGDGASTSSSGE